jgi:hypothetical protein
VTAPFPMGQQTRPLVLRTQRDPVAPVLDSVRRSRLSVEWKSVHHHTILRASRGTRNLVRRAQTSAGGIPIGYGGSFRSASSTAVAHGFYKDSVFNTRCCAFMRPDPGSGATALPALPHSHSVPIGSSGSGSSTTLCGRDEMADRQRADWGRSAVSGGRGGMTAGAERGAKRLAAEGLSALALSVRAIADESVNLRVGDVIIGAAAIGAGHFLRINPLWGAPATFDHGSGGTGGLGTWVAVRAAAVGRSGNRLGCVVSGGAEAAQRPGMTGGVDGVARPRSLQSGGAQAAAPANTHRSSSALPRSGCKVNGRCRKDTEDS